MFQAKFADSIFAIFNKINPWINDTKLFFKNIHLNIKFTIENEINDFFHFLYIDIK